MGIRSRYYTSGCRGSSPREPLWWSPSITVTGYRWITVGYVGLSEVIGAQERTRTSTSLRILAPEASASTIPPPGPPLRPACNNVAAPCQRGFWRFISPVMTGCFTGTARVGYDRAQQREINVCHNLSQFSAVRGLWDAILPAGWRKKAGGSGLQLGGQMRRYL